MRNVDAPLERVWREERLAIVATLARRLDDIDLAEDALQDAFAAAVVRWQVDGVPERPAAWLLTAAWRRALDMRRRATTRDDPLGLHPDLPAPDTSVAWTDETNLPIEDDRLALILACTHPSLAPDARVALTLRHVAGLTAREIAAAFLTTEATMEKRLVRARAKIREAGIRFAIPQRHELAARLGDVHAVLYLVFTEGYLASGSGEAIRTALCAEAIWLATQLLALVPNDHETCGLLALFMLQHARAGARLDERGRLVPFSEQDSGRWDVTAIDAARALLARTGDEPPGPYQLEAAIALLHAAAVDGQVPWRQVASLYGVLHRVAPQDVVAVNRAYALGRSGDPQAGLALLRPVVQAGRLDTYAPLHATIGDLLDRAGEVDAASQAWARAVELAKNPTQQEQLRRTVAARQGVRL